MSSQIPNINSDHVLDIDLPISRTKCQFGNDDNRVVYVDLSDFNLISRLNEAYPKLKALAERVAELGQIEPAEGNDIVKAMGDKFTEIDAEMRELVNYIFDANVSDAAMPSGNMYNLYNGDYAFEIIIRAMLAKCTEGYQTEFEKLKKKIGRHTDKYTKKKR